MILIGFSVNIVIFRLFIHQSNPNFYNGNFGFINKSTCASIPLERICNDTLDCLFVLNSFMLNGSVAILTPLSVGAPNSGVSKSISAAIHQEWIRNDLLQVFSIFLFLDVVVMAMGLVFVWVGIMKYLESATKFVIFVLTSAVVLSGVVIHQDNPFGPMFNVITGIVTLSFYCYLVFFHVEISHQKLKVRKYSVI